MVWEGDRRHSSPSRESLSLTVNTGTGVGTVRLDVTDADTIMDASSNPLGGAGAGNGNFTSGQAYDVVAPGAIPLLDPRALALLAVMLAAIAIFVMRRV